jgi:hypothetical protein
MFFPPGTPRDKMILDPVSNITSVNKSRKLYFSRNMPSGKELIKKMSREKPYSFLPLQVLIIYRIPCHSCG